MGFGFQFRMAIQSINSGWDVGRQAMASNISGKRYKVYYIKSGYSREPTVEECKAIARELDCFYSFGYFYKEVV